MTFLHRVLAAEDFDFAWEDFASCIEDWVSRPTQISFLQLADMASSLDEKSPLKKPSFQEVYRGIELTSERQKKLAAGQKIKIAPGSWSYDEDEAKRFAEGYAHGLVVERKVKSSDIILNLKACTEYDPLGDLLSQSTKDTINNEAEIILKGFQFSDKNIVWKSDGDGSADDEF